jgi:type IV pilus assembly protein PilC
MGIFSPQISAREMVPLCRQLSTSYGAGIPIIQSLETISGQARDGTVKRVLRTMSDDLRGGDTLGASAFAQSRHLPPFFIQLLAAGEQGGRLDVMLSDLAQYFEDKLAMQRKLLGMMIYPIIQLTFAWFLGTFALGILGVVRESFSGGGGAGGVIEYFHEYLVFQGKAMIIFAALLLVAVILSRKGLLRWVTGAVGTHVWPFRGMVRKFGLARFFRSFGLLVGAGLPMGRCVEQSAGVAGNPYLEKDILQAVPRIQDGQTLVEAFYGCKFLTPLAREMILVGEQTGNLEEQCKKVAEYHLAETTHASEIASKALSAAIVLAVALLVGYIVISFYSGLYGGMMNGLEI